MPVICHNGLFLDADAPALPAGNPSFKWGEGLFETMKLAEGRIVLLEKHWQRLAHGLNVLGLNAAALQTHALENLLLQLALRNNCAEQATLRLHVFAEGAGLGFVAEATALNQQDLVWNETGWTIGIYEGARKSIDLLSRLKCASYLPYRLAARWAKENICDDSIVLNSAGRPCESSIANLFCIRGNTVRTPPLSEGPVAGVMRAQVLGLLCKEGVNIEEEPITVDELRASDELFLTNALKGIRWVARFEEKTYGCTLSRQFYQLLQQTF